MRAQIAHIRLAVILIPVALYVSACAPETAAPVNDDALSFSAAKAVSTTDMSVTGATPDSATQDTTLDVVINGSGFVSGAAANWALAGVQDPAQVKTNSTRYVNSRQLVANITISATATVANWDIVVTATGKKGGIGTEAFAIRQNKNLEINSRGNIVFDASVNVAPPGQPPLVAPAGIQGDLRDKFGTAASFSEYQGKFCGVRSVIFWSGTNFSGDLVFDADIDYSVSNGCGLPRTLNFYLSYQAGGSTGAPTSAATFTNIRQVMQMNPGEIRSQATHFNYVGLSNCSRLDFDAAMAGASNVTVTRLPDVNGARQYRVESQYPHMAMCVFWKGGKYVQSGLKYLPFAFTATEVPYPYPSYP